MEKIFSLLDKSKGSSMAIVSNIDMGNETDRIFSSNWKLTDAKKGKLYTEMGKR